MEKWNVYIDWVQHDNLHRTYTDINSCFNQSTCEEGTGIRARDATVSKCQGYIIWINLDSFKTFDNFRFARILDILDSISGFHIRGWGEARFEAGAVETAEYLQKSLPEVTDEPIDGKVNGGVDELEELDWGHDVDEPYRCEALQVSSHCK